MTIRILCTGGTFDKEFNELDGSLVFRETHLPSLLKLGRCQLELSIETLMLKDSLAMTELDRELILRRCQDSPETRIVITHGTDTLTETARMLAAHSLPKTVVLTGAMIPIAFGSSDGLFNLSSALAFAQVLPSGVYVSMHGLLFPALKVIKNKILGRFEALP